MNHDSPLTPAGADSEIPRSPRWWQWPTVLSLDATAVALLWQWQIARAGGITLGFAPRFVLAASVWLAYAGDRWLEGWRIAPGRVRTDRHRFYQRWRWPIFALAAAVLASDLLGAARGLSSRQFDAGLVLLAAVLAYLFSHQMLHRHHPWRVPKEACVALLFGGGVAVFLVGPSLASLRPIAAPLGLFMLLCFANCALISVWEHAVDQSHGATSLAGQFHWGAAFSRVLPWVLAGVALGRWPASSASERPVDLCALTSSLLLGLLDWAEPRLGRRGARVLADLALMTPVVALVLSR